MTQWSNTHLMFCEGPHDAAFLNRLLKKELGFSQRRLKVSDLPYPLGNVLRKSLADRSAEDLRLDLARKFFLPDHVLAREETLVLVFSYGGSNRQCSLSTFLENVFPLLDAPVFSSFGQEAAQSVYAYTIFADADARGEAGTRDLICDEFATVGGSAWLSNEWQRINRSRAAYQPTLYGPVATYIWRNSQEDRGTLEDLILECLDGDDNLMLTLSHLDARFDWAAPPGATPDQICAGSARRLKAAFCVEGQKQKPGGGLSVVLDQSDLLRVDSLKKSAAVQDCLTFLNDWFAWDPSVQSGAA